MGTLARDRLRAGEQAGQQSHLREDHGAGTGQSGGGRDATGVGEGAHPGRERRLHPEGTVLDDGTARWLRSQRLRGVEEQVWSGLAVGDIGRAEDFGPRSSRPGPSGRGSVGPSRGRRSMRRSAVSRSRRAPRGSHRQVRARRRRCRGRAGRTPPRPRAGQEPRCAARCRPGCRHRNGRRSAR